MIDRNKVISQSRQREVEHNFEAMVGSRKNRYCNTPEQKKRTEFFEDYYLLYTRKDEEITVLKKALELAQETICMNKADCDYCSLYDICDSWTGLPENYFLNKAKEMLENG